MNYSFMAIGIEQDYLFDPKNVYVVYTADTINIIKMLWLSLASHVNQHI